jgi:hypothetical protein
MNCLVPLALAMLLPSQAGSDRDAKALAQDILTKGAALFDTRDAAAMAATYAEGAEVLVASRDQDTGRIKVQTYHGRADIQKGYADLFEDRSPSARSRNVVEAAHFLGPDLLAIHGTFTLDTRDSNAEGIPFIQVRVKQGDAWRILTLELFAVSEK